MRTPVKHHNNRSFYWKFIATRRRMYFVGFCWRCRRCQQDTSMHTNTINFGFFFYWMWTLAIDCSSLCKILPKWSCSVINIYYCNIYTNESVCDVCGWRKGKQEFPWQYEIMWCVKYLWVHIFCWNGARMKKGRSSWWQNILLFMFCVWFSENCCRCLGKGCDDSIVWRNFF